MEKTKVYTSKRRNIPPGHHPNEVYVLRDWKEYAGESLLIIFSVLLALGLTEAISYFHEKTETTEILRNVNNELARNKARCEEQYTYQKKVLKNIDSAMSNKAFEQKIFNNGEFYLTKYIAPQGVLLRDLDDVAWQIAKEHNIASKVGLKTITLLNNIYDNQSRIMKLENEVGAVLLSREAHDPKNARTTLILVRDNYKGWAFDRTPELIRNYNRAIKLLSDTH